MRIGDRVGVIGIPNGLPADGDEASLNTSSVFQSCLGHVFHIVAYNEVGLAELDVGEVTGQEPYMSTIWIEPEFLIVIDGED